MIICAMEIQPAKKQKRELYLEEAARLRAIWDATPNRLSQAEFGEAFNIGGQSAVGNFLKGTSPLSLKAATGFARGLGVAIEQFSPRLAEEAKAIAVTINASRSSDELPAFARGPGTEPPKQHEGQSSRSKYLVAVHEPKTERQIGMVLLEATSLSDAHARGLRLIQQHQAAEHINAEHVSTVVFEVFSLRPAQWD